MSETPEALREELEALRRENVSLSDQVKRLVRTETRLYAFQEQLDTQQGAYRRLGELGQEFARLADGTEMFPLVLDFVLYAANFERCVILLREEGRFTTHLMDGYYNDAERDRVRAVTLRDDDPLLAELQASGGLLTVARGTEPPTSLVSLCRNLALGECVVAALGSEFGTSLSGLLIAGSSHARARHHVRVHAEAEVLTMISILTHSMAVTLENLARHQALLQRNIEVEKANVAKSAFLATMSHELRTPLNAIIGFTRIVMRKCEPVLPKRQHENLEKVYTSAQNLLSLINDILDLSKVEAGRTEIVVSELDLPKLLRQVVDELAPLAAAKDITLELQVPDEAFPVRCDPKRLRQMIVNLVSNAIKFTKEGGVIVSLRERPGDCYQVLVTDTGIGIAADQLEEIFEPFHQVDGSHTREVAGTGLGLSITRQLAELLGGRVTVESTVGEGTTFTMTMPRGGPPRLATTDEHREFP